MTNTTDTKQAAFEDRDIRTLTRHNPSPATFARLLRQACPAELVGQVFDNLLDLCMELDTDADQPNKAKLVNDIMSFLH